MEQVSSKTAEELFLSHLALIERVTGFICRRQRLIADDCDDFGAWLKLKLIDDNYRRLRKFQGKSSISTYLTAVVNRLAHDYRDSLLGKWRPSSQAKRLGPEAVRLDTLINRDGHSVAEAVAILRDNEGVERTAAELEDMAASLPSHPPRRFEGDGQLAVAQAAEDAAQRLHDRDRDVLSRRVKETLEGAMAVFSAEDCLLIKMCLQDGFSMARIATILGVAQKPLYRRRDKLKNALRQALEAAGLTFEQVAELFGWEGLSLRLDFSPTDGEIN